MRGRITSARTHRSADERVRPIIVAVMVPIVLAAIGGLLWEFGFPVSREMIVVLHWVQVAGLVSLLAEPLVGLLLVRDRTEALLGRWFHFALAGAMMVVIGVLYASRAPAADFWAIRAVQVAIVVNLAMRLVELHRLLALLHVRPAILFLGGFLGLIGIGTVLLMLPASTVPGEGTTLMDALFTATSSVCVTGLVVVDTGTHWSTLGRYVILTLIQLGGLGVMTFGSVFALLLWRGMRVRESVLMREVLRSELLSEVGRIIVFILLTTFAFEAIGALLLMGLWDHTATAGSIAMGDRVQYSIFHSISAFCNAGFCLYGRSLMDYRSTWQVNVVFPVLIIGGGMGFMVLYNFARLVRYRASGWRQAPLVKRRLRLQPKLALTTTAVLLVVGTGLVFLFEAMPGHNRPAGATNASPAAAGDFPALGPAGLGPMGGKWTDQLEGAWFLSVTARTAGFNSTDTSLLAPSTKFLTILLMFIGASPGSTGGGIKTVTLAVIVVGVWSALRGYGSAQAFRRTIAPGLVLRALTILAISVMWVALVTLVVAAWGLRDGSQCTFLDVLFETVSAYATVGLSTGTTTVLNTVGRVLIIATMYVGRVGPLTLFVAMPVAEGEQRYDYPTENVAIS